MAPTKEKRNERKSKANKMFLRGEPNQNNVPTELFRIFISQLRKLSILYAHFRLIHEINLIQELLKVRVKDARPTYVISTLGVLL